MKINVAVGTIEGFGGIKTLAEITKGLSKRGHQMSIVLIDPQPLIFDWGDQTKIIVARSTLESLKRKSVLALNKIYGFYNAPYRFYAEKDDLIKVMPECDINLSGNVGTVFAVYESKKGIPVHYLQHYESLIFKEQNIFMKEKFVESLSLPIYRIVNFIWLQGQLKQRHNLDVSIINPGLKSEMFYPRKVEKSSTKRIVSLAKNIEWKGFTDALEAVKLVREKYPEIEFVTYGARCFHYNNPPTQFKFRCNLSDDELANLYSSADVVISASWYESFPGPPFEAMACGVPVVTTSIGVEDYARDGFNCLIVPPKNPQKMAEAIIKILENSSLAEQLSQNASASVKKFTWEKTLDQFEQYFEEILRQNKVSKYDKK